MTHDYPSNDIRHSYFTHPDYRKQDIAAIMQRALLGDIFKGSYYEDEIWTFRHKCTKCNKFFYGSKERTICKLDMNTG